MHSTQAPFYHHYRLSSSINRHVGSQGIVQFASFDNGRHKVRLVGGPRHTCMIAVHCTHALRTDAEAAVVAAGCFAKLGVMCLAA